MSHLHQSIFVLRGFKIDIESQTLENVAYRRVLYTTKQSQLVVMSIPTGDDIDREVHRHTTQFIRIEQGTCVVYVDDKQYRLKDGDCVMIPAGATHYVKNTSDKVLKLYTFIYFLAN